MRRFLITLLCFVPWFAQAQLESTSDLQRGLVGWWKFDTGTGTNAFDLSGNNNTGTLSGSTLPVWTNGVFGGALSFDGAHACVHMTTGFSSITNATISFWFSPNITYNSANAGNQRLYNYFVSSSKHFDFIISINGAPVNAPSGSLDVFTYDSTSSEAWSSNATWVSNVWHHSVVTMGSAGLIMYIDGISQPNTNVTTRSFSTIGNGVTTLGAYNLGASSFVNAKIDDVRIYNRALSATEVLNLYCQGGGRTP